MIPAYLQQLRSFHRDVRLFLLAAALQGMSISGIRAVLFNLYLLRLGYGPEFVGLASAAGWIALSTCSPIAGAMGTRWGSRRAMLGGFALMIAGTGLLPLAEAAPTSWQATWLIVCTMCMYAGLAFYFVNTSVYLMAASEPAQQNQVFALQVSLEPLAGFAGSLIGGALPAFFATALGVSSQHPAPYRYPQFLAALVLIPGWWALRGARDLRWTHSHGSSSKVSPAPFVLIGVLTIAVMMRIAGRAAVGVFFNVYLDTELFVPTTVIGALAAFAQLLAAPAALAVTSAVRRWGPVRTVAVASLGMAASILPIALIPHWTAAGLGYVALTAGFAMTTGPLRVFIQRAVAPRWRATTSGIAMSGVGLTNVAMSLAGGYGVSTVGFREMFLVGAVLTAAGALLFWSYFRVPRGEFARVSDQVAAE